MFDIGNLSSFCFSFLFTIVSLSFNENYRVKVLQVKNIRRNGELKVQVWKHQVLKLSTNKKSHCLDFSHQHAPEHGHVEGSAA